LEFHEIDTGKLLKTIRKHAGLTQAELAQLVNTEQSKISKIENNVITLYMDFLMECVTATGTKELAMELLFGKEVVEKVKTLMTNGIQTDKE